MTFSGSNQKIEGKQTSRTWVTTTGETKSYVYRNREEKKMLCFLWSLFLKHLDFMTISKEYFLTRNHKFNQFYRKKMFFLRRYFFPDAVEIVFPSNLNKLSIDAVRHIDLANIIFLGKTTKKRKVDVKAISNNWLLAHNWHGNPLISFMAEDQT